MSSDAFTAMTAQKVRTFGRTPAIWTASGSVFVMEEVTNTLETIDTSGSPTAPLASFTTPDLKAIREKLHSSINPVMGKAYQKALGSVPFQPGAIPFQTDFLLLGYTNGTPWFLELAGDGQANWHTAQKFYSIGSGGPFAAVAKALMGHYIDDDLTLEDGKLLAYGTIATTIEVSNAHVGFPVQIATCDENGARILDAAEIDEIKTAVDRWKVLESDILRAQKDGEEEIEDAEPLPSLSADEDR
ncbi:hypothetical protein [Cellulomonas fengjieae]|uniref:Uncharacterized protein n=1 Tax=Cellulomonas fengjieae TaxID=2819978 RepID=A0ABS3SNW7_9CELL|nr:hypothetical protein [Cellulomonas fengjieae]MBO3086631.1 hypothetical protein [Cellulomonas fengjieae]QVI66520.1 hypothetical protein KG102_02620 [Cellulomonas fengjieae]